MTSKFASHMGLFIRATNKRQNGRCYHAESRTRFSNGTLDPIDCHLRRRHVASSLSSPSSSRSLAPTNVSPPSTHPSHEICNYGVHLRCTPPTTCSSSIPCLRPLRDTIDVDNEYNEILKVDCVF